MSAASNDAVWKNVRDIFERMQADAPEGFTARVRVTLVDGETFEPRQMAEISNSDWIIFEVDEPGTDSSTEHRREIAARPEAIARVEVSFVRGEKGPVGFSLGPRPG
jgi:hypothetical protein